MEAVFQAILKIFSERYVLENSDFKKGFVTSVRLFAIGYRRTTSFNFKLLFERSRVKFKETRAKLYQAKRLLGLSLERNEKWRQVYEKKNLELDEKYGKKMNDLRKEYFQKNIEYQKESEQRVSCTYQAYQEKLQKNEHQYHQEMISLKDKVEELYAKKVGGYEEGTVLVLKRAHALELLLKDKKYNERFETSRKAQKENMEKLKLENEKLHLALQIKMDTNAGNSSQTQISTLTKYEVEAIEALKKAHALELTVKEKKYVARLDASRKVHKDNIAEIKAEMQNLLIIQQRKIDKASVNQAQIEIIKKLENNFNKKIEIKNEIINELYHEIESLRNPGQEDQTN